MYKLIINMKTYRESLGEKAVEIAKICKELEFKARQYGVEIVLCPSYIDLRDVAKVGVKTYSQHIDDMDFGAHTGYIVPDVIKDCGAVGTLINHSEHNLTFNYKEIERRVDFARKADLEICICARNHKVAKKVAKYEPDFIAVEPRELIGGDISVSTAKPDLISNSVRAAGDVPLLTGAGVKNKHDVRRSLELGAKGILVASGVVKAKDVKSAIIDLLEGFSQ